MGERLLGATGWHRDIPDFRDLTSRSEKIRRELGKSNPLAAAQDKLPPRVDLRRWCPAVEDQGVLSSCTASAAVGLIEYFEKRAFGRYLDASRLFLYKVTRNLERSNSDKGASLRSTMKAMVLFGVPPETYWPYEPQRVNEEPPAFDYAFASNYKSISYFRLDGPGVAPAELLSDVKLKLAGGFPSMFGISLYSSFPRIGAGLGDIPFPGEGDRLIGGHAVMAIGYDDTHRIADASGALLIRNSWGEAWGENGCGWIPYRCVEQGLAVDFWTLVRAEFPDSELFR